MGLITVSEYAEREGITKNYAYILTRGKLKGCTVRQNGRLYIDTELLEGGKKPDKTPENPAQNAETNGPAAAAGSNDEMIQLLRKVIDDKDREIEFLRQQLASMTQQLSNITQISGVQAKQLYLTQQTGASTATEATEAAETEEVTAAGESCPKEPEASTTPTERPQRKRGLFGLFRK